MPAEEGGGKAEEERRPAESLSVAKKSLVSLSRLTSPWIACVPWSRPELAAVSAPSTADTLQGGEALSAEKKEGTLLVSCSPLSGTSCQRDSDCWGFGFPFGYCDSKTNACVTVETPRCLPLLQKLLALQLREFRVWRERAMKKTSREGESLYTDEALVRQQFNYEFLFADFSSQLLSAQSGVSGLGLHSAEGSPGGMPNKLPFESADTSRREEVAFLRAALLCCLKYKESQADDSPLPLLLNFGPLEIAASWRFPWMATAPSELRGSGQTFRRLHSRGQLEMPSQHSHSVPGLQESKVKNLQTERPPFQKYSSLHWRSLASAEDGTETLGCDLSSVDVILENLRRGFKVKAPGLEASLVEASPSFPQSSLPTNSVAIARPSELQGQARRLGESRYSAEANLAAEIKLDKPQQILQPEHPRNQQHLHLEPAPSSHDFSKQKANLPFEKATPDVSSLYSRPSFLSASWKKRLLSKRTSL